MATFKIIISDYKRADETYQIRIRVIHKKIPGYIPTEFYVKKEDLNTKGELIDNALIVELEGRITSYRRILLTLTDRDYCVGELIDIIKSNPLKPKEPIDLMAYFQSKINERSLTLSKNTITGYDYMMKNLKQFLGGVKLTPDYLNVKLLNAFSLWLRIPKEHTNNKSLRTAGNTTIRLYMAYLKSLTLTAISELNTEKETVIKVNPFDKYKYKMPPPSPVASKAIDIFTIRKIRDYTPEIFFNKTGKRRKVQSDQVEIFARDCFMIMLYLAGPNPKDLYYMPKSKYNKIVYRRAKVVGKMGDRAKTSIKIQPELALLVNKYSDKERLFCFYKMYKSERSFNVAINDGLSRISKKLMLNITLTAGTCRTSFSTIASNDLLFQDSDIDMALVHSDPTMLGKYKEKDFTKIDRIIRAFIDFMDKQEQANMAVV